jgi:hypothetical protein
MAAEHLQLRNIALLFVFCFAGIKQSGLFLGQSMFVVLRQTAGGLVRQEIKRACLPQAGFASVPAIGEGLEIRKGTGRVLHIITLGGCE